jgi:hypothetical protein
MPDDARKISVEEMRKELSEQLYMSKQPGGLSQSPATQALTPAVLEISKETRHELDQASNQANAAASPAERVKCSQQYYDLCQQYIPDSSEAFHATCFLAYANKLANNRAAAFAAAREAMALQTKLGLGPSRDALESYSTCLQACLADHDVAGARKYAGHFFKMNESLYPNDPARLAQAEMRVGYIWTLEKYYDDAGPYYLRAKQVLESNHLTSSVDYKGTIDMLETIQKLKSGAGNVHKS